MCVEGASLVQKKALDRINSDNLRVFVIWTPRYPGDSRTKAVAATKIVPDSRATHFWDSDGMVSKVYGDVLELPEGNRFAWDTYMIFGADAAWLESPPAPLEWMHQLGVLGEDHPRWLDGDRFRESVKSLVK
jgi:hypothetical protein